ncbi:MAG TPA: sulfotransferase [Caulobacteraceae bacterium]|nr:sulfotransferase [Caulobacteraceae bacterium]
MPNSAPASYEEAQRLLVQGRSRDAALSLERGVEANPRLGVAWRLLADIRLVSGDVAGAQRAYDRMLAAVIPDLRLRPAADALADGRPLDTERGLRVLLNADGSNLPAAHLMAEALARRGELAAAEALLVHCLERAPQLHLARQSLALLLHRQGRHDEALAELDRLLVREPRNTRCRAAKAAILAEIGDYAGAAVVTAALLEDFPDQPQAWIVHGAGLRTLGRIDEAVAAFQRALTLDPARAEAWWSLANLKSYRFTPDDRARMDQQLAAPEADPADRSLIHFALAKADEDDGRDAGAFAHYASANALQRGLRAYDADATTALVQRSKSLFTRDFFAERAGWGDPAGDPIFIVGLPRSGSTLVEQILASHPQVEGTRELMDIQAMADWTARLAPDLPHPASLAALPRAVFDQLGHDYLARTRVQRRLGRARFIDKAPWNFQHVGLIRLMLPNARIVDVRRHPLACCVSAFRQHFAGGFDFAYDLGDLGRYYADYVDLMAHFDAVLPGQVTRVIYEDLVADTEGQVRRLLEALGLPFDPVCLRFFENPRAVATPSSEQVRRPIYADGVDSWRRFESWLDPLKAALGPVLDAYPSPP